MIFLMNKTFQATVLAISVAVASGSVMAQDAKLGTVPAPKQTAAVKLANPAPDGLILGATRIGQRVVTVGDRGVILLSDDQGKTWKKTCGPSATGA